MEQKRTSKVGLLPFGDTAHVNQEGGSETPSTTFVRNQHPLSRRSGHREDVSVVTSRITGVDARRNK